MESTIPKKVACQRLSALGLRQNQVYQVLSIVQKWVDNEGPENTVKRIKTIKNLFVRKWSKAEPIFPEWLKYHMVEGYAVPKGIFGSLFDMGRKSQKMLSALMVYSTYQSTKVTVAQWKKFQESVEADSKYLCGFENSRNFDIFKRKLVRKGWNIPENIDLDATILVPNNTRMPYLSGFSTISESEVEGGLTRMVNFGCHADPGSLKIIEILKRNPKNHIRFFESNYPMGVNTLAGGKIGFIQEPGLKLRVVANPLRHHQFILKPLKSNLLAALRKFEQDCTHDQEKGIYDIQSWLRDGLVLSSVDLSDATNLFPAELTFNLLKRLYSGTDFEHLVDYFREVSRREWLINPRVLPKGYERSSITWSKGQPLGLGPSFPAFALSHHFVMMGVEQKLKNKGLLRPDEDLKYRILGDDIVMDARAEETYHSIMVDELQCKISWDKSLSNCRVAEFASRIISEDKILRQYKWKEFSDDNFIEVAKQYGTCQSFGLFPKRQRDVLKRLAEVPSQFGGLGFNPKGKTMDTRVGENLSLIRLLESSEKGVSQRWAETYRLKNRYQAMPYSGISPIYDASNGNLVRSTYPDKGTQFHNDDEGYSPNFITADLEADTLLPGYVSTTVISGKGESSTLEILERKLTKVTNDRSESLKKPRERDAVSTDKHHVYLTFKRIKCILQTMLRGSSELPSVDLESPHTVSDGKPQSEDRGMSL